MTDDTTRAGAGGLDPEKTQMSARRLQVRMASGKIYGPYQRVEVLGFIVAQRLQGDEHILYEGSGDWKEITSDPEFFDAFQESVFGVAPKKKPKASSPGVAKTEVVPEPQPLARSPKPKPPAAPPVPMQLPSFNLKISEPVSTVDLDEAPVPHHVPAKKLPIEKVKKNRLWIPIAAAGAIILIVMRMPENQRAQRDSGGNYLLSPIKTTLAYGKPLTILMDDLKVAVPGMLGTPSPMEAWTLPEGLGAYYWVGDMVQLASEDAPEAKGSAAYWGRWAWDLEWLGATVMAFDKDSGAAITQEGERIYERLKSKKLVPKAETAMFESIPLFVAGKWDEASAKLEPVKDNEFAQWLAEEASWWSFWDKSAAGGKVLQLKETYFSADLDLSSKLRSAIVKRENSIPEYIEEMALRDPRSASLWLSAAEFYWRLNSDQAQRANGRFVMGLATLALLPPSFQTVYWKQYTEFLATFGRETTAQRAASNRDIIKTGRIRNPSAWWDLNQEGLDITRIATEILSRAASAPLLESDIAGLQVLGPVIPQGAEALNAAGEHLAFEEEWKRAIPMFKAALKVNNQNITALGGLVWSYASLYQFDKALEIYERLSQVPTDTAEAQKYEALIHLSGREYDEAEKLLFQYSKGAPQDPWGHYYMALLGLRQDQNVTCAKSANLARIHATGELKFRAGLLYLKCRILSNVGVTDALNELKALNAKNDHNIPVVMTLTESLVALELTDEAQKLTEDTLRKSPRSYKLRLRLGEIYEKKRDYDKAVAFYSSASKERKDAADAWIHIARVYEAQDKPLDAARNYETAGHLNPEYPEIWLFAARAYAKAGKWREAADLYIKEIDERPAVLSSFIEAAEFMLKNNAPQEVPKIFQKFKSDYEDDPRVLTRLAQAYLALKQYDNARVAASSASAGAPTLAEPYRILAACDEAQGLYDTSKQRYQKYLQINPSAADADTLRLKLSKPPFTQ